MNRNELTWLPACSWHSLMIMNPQASHLCSQDDGIYSIAQSGSSHHPLDRTPCVPIAQDGPLAGNMHATEPLVCGSNSGRESDPSPGSAALHAKGRTRAL